MFAPVYHLFNDAVLTLLCIGPIPVGIGQLRNLIELYLNSNKLTGLFFLQSRGSKVAPSNRMVNQ